MKLNGPRVKLNAAMIPSKVAPGSPFGAAYSLVDGVPPKSTYYYWLEDVDIYGVRTLHGPVPVTMGQ
jgi:hypothetical protein